MKEFVFGIIINTTSPATDYYRGIGAFKYLDGEILPDGRRLKIEPLHPDDLQRTAASWYKLDKCDVVYCQRPNGGILQILNEAKLGMKKKLVIDIDDYLLWLPKGNPARWHFNKPNTRQTVNQGFQLADLVIVSTDHLRDLFIGVCAPAVIPNALDDQRYRWQPIRPQGRPVRMAWRGSATHLMDVYEIRDVLHGIRRNSLYQLAYFGWEPPFDAAESQSEINLLSKFHGVTPEELGIPYDEKANEIAFFDWAGSFFGYMDTLANYRPDWLIVPLENNIFNLAKSNIAWIEAIWAGAAVLAPAGLPEFDRPGVVLYDSPEHLQELIDEIGTGMLDKSEYVMQGREEIRARYWLSDVNRRRLSIIEELAAQTVAV